jgi:hypothetical protein
MFREYLISNGGISSYTQREELKRLKFYLETFEHFISQQESSEIVALEADSAHLNEEDKSEFWSWYYPVHWDEIFRTNLRSSFLISLMSLTESHLTEVCRDVAIIARTPITISDLRGSLLEKARLFLERFASFKQPTPDLWSRMFRIYDIRNVFVHNGGYLPASNHEARVRHFIRASSGVAETNGSLTLKKEFCPFVLDVVTKLSEAISAELVALRRRTQLFESRK